MRSLGRLVALAPLGLVSLTCSTEPEALSCEERAERARSVAAAECASLPPVVSLRDDVMPIFARACAFSSCHLGSGRPKGGVYLGPNVNNTGEDGPGDPFHPARTSELEAVYESLLASSERAPEWRRVVPGEPDSSFLQVKLDGLQGCLEIPCVEKGKPADCGDDMPQGQTRLSACERRTVRRWIEQGAALAPGCVADDDCDRSGQACCAGRCTSVSTDADHCGACDVECPAESYCGAGRCSCAAGLESCGGGCFDTGSSVDHCGGCDERCPAVENAEEACLAGECGYRCLPGRAECNADPSDGCERALALGEALPTGCARGGPPREP